VSDEKRYFTLVYEYTPAFMNYNPFNYETPWGSAEGVSIGDVLHESTVYEEALQEIANGSCDADQIAAKALEEIEDYRRSQDWRNPMLNDWRPMETAPAFKHVLLWLPKGQHVVALIGKTPDRYEMIGYMGNDEPTHWRELPPGPGQLA
jgi:hypothetical protein